MKKYLTLAVGILLLSQSAKAQPANDNPCGAFPLSMQTGTHCTPSNPFSWTGATATAGIPDPGCASYLTGDIWYTFVAPASGQANINTVEGTGAGAIVDGGLAVYSNAGACSAASFVLIDCDDDGTGGLMPALNMVGLIPGTTYYIRFWDYYDATSGNFGGICVTDPNPPLTNGKIGIGLINPDAQLDINGSIKIRGGTPGLGKVLTSDDFGGASWELPGGTFAPIPFKAIVTSDITVATGSSISLTYGSEEYDDGGNFGTTTFNAPADGIYHFDATVNWSLSGVAASSSLQLMLFVNGSLKHGVVLNIPASTGPITAQTLSADLSLLATDAVTVRVSQNTGVNQTILGNGVSEASYFNGHRIK